MRYRKLDANGDYTLGSGADFHINSVDAVAQAISTRLKLWQSEFFYDVTDGTPYETEVLGKRNGRNPDTAIKQRILGTPGVTSLESFSSTFDGETRVLTISATVNTQYGQTTINEVL